MSATIKYNNSTIASVEDGSSVTLVTKDTYMADNIIVEVAAPSYEIWTGGSYGS